MYGAMCVGEAQQRRRAVRAQGRLDGVSLSISPGDLIGVRGSNGAGKTTLLRLLVNAYRPNSGVRQGPKRSAYVPSVIEPPALSARSWLAGVPRPVRADSADALGILGFDGDLNASCRALSFGNLRKLMLAEAFTSGESLVVVDEASAGLDDAGLAGVHTLIERARASSKTIVLADQESRPFPAGTSVLRVADGAIRAESVDGEKGSITLHGPLASRQFLLDQAQELGFTPVQDER